MTHLCQRAVKVFPWLSAAAAGGLAAVHGCWWQVAVLLLLRQTCMYGTRRSVTGVSEAPCKQALPCSVQA